MFDGSFKSRKQVRLSGRTRQEEKREFLHRAREERHQRAQERKRQHASIRIQAKWRAVCTQERIRTRFFDQTARKVQDIAQLERVLSASGHTESHVNLPSDALLRMLTEYTFAVASNTMRQYPTTQKHREVFQTMVKLLVRNIQNTSIETNIFATLKTSTAVDEITRLMWIRVISAFLTQCVHELSTEDASVDMSTDASELKSHCFQLLSTVFSNEIFLVNCPLLLGFHPMEFLLLRTAAPQNAERGIFHGLIQFLQDDNTRSVSTPERTSVLALFESLTTRVLALVVLPCTSVHREKFSSLIYHRFLASFLRIPRILQHSKAREFMSRLLEGSHDVQQKIQMTLSTLRSEHIGTERLSLAGNLLDLTGIFGLASFGGILASIVGRNELVAGLAQISLPSPLEGSSKVDEMEEDKVSLEVDWNSFSVGQDHSASFVDLEKNALQAREQMIETVLHSHSLAPSEVPSKNQFERLILANTMHSFLLYPILHNRDPKSYESTTTGSSHGDGGVVLHMCSLYSSVVLFFGEPFSLSAMQPYTSHASTVLNALVYSHPKNEVLSELWNFISSRVDLHQYAKDEKYAKGTSEPEIQSALYLLLAGFSHCLCTLDDEAFFVRQEFLSMHEVYELISFIKQLLYRVYWKAFPSLSQTETSVETTGFVIVLIRVFNQLHDRMSRTKRLSVCRPDLWLWPPFPQHELDAVRSDFDDVCTPLSHILRTIPQVLPFDQRVAIFQRLLEEDRARAAPIREIFENYPRASVRREFILQDSLEMFQRISSGSSGTGGGTGLKGRMQISFVNEQGLNEAGVDGGGLFKEFMDTLTRQAFDPQYSLFLLTEDQLLYPNPASEVSVENHLQQFHFLGQVLGKALYEGILVEPQFAGFFLNKLLAKYNYVDDLQTLDPELYHNLMYLKGYEVNVDQLCLTMSLTQNQFGKNLTLDLVPNGRNVPITSENRIRYIHLVAHNKLNVQCSAQCRAFLRGFRDLIPTQWIRMFNTDELQMLIGGSTRDIDVEDFEKNTLYGGGYHPSQPIVQWFWQVIREMTAQERGELLKFITSCSRQPLQGFGKLQPLICIQQVRVPNDDRLPTSSTCMNLLKLPKYSSKEALREKLLYAIHSKAGFELS